MIHVEDLSIRYGDHRAVAGLDLHVPEGAFFGLLGPNGAGKTSTVGALSGFVERCGGSIRVAGFDPASESRRVRAALGVVPQELALFLDLTVLDNLRVFAGLYGLRGSAMRDRIEWGLALSQLEGRSGARVSALSGGMARRLNLACGLLHDPPIIICDEPTTGVDPHSRTHIHDTLRALNAEGRTLVYTTHYMAEVEALCSRVAIIDHGRVIAEGELADLLAASEGTGYAIATSDGLPLSAQAVEAALRAAGIDVEAVRATPRSLEDLFLDLTGRSLRDGA